MWTAPIVHAAWRGLALGRYVCLAVLGVGASGIVFRAHDRARGREVAIKLPRRAEAPQRWAARARLLREAEALGAVRHRHVVGLHEVGVADGFAYLVMQALDAAPLDRRALTWRAALTVGRQIGGALAAVHAAGWVHRDVTPRNILVAAAGHAWLIDFGLARALDPASVGEERFAALAISGPGPAPGTPNFMAPEQRRGEAVDARADQYALCATLYCCIAGAPDALPARLAAVLRTGMTERPEHRHRDMPALVAALAGCRPS